MTIAIGGRRGTIRSVHDLAAQPWRNGGGITRVVTQAAPDPGAHADVDPAWRVSMATVNDGAIFSKFPGYDRIFMPLEKRVTLDSADGSLPTSPDGSVHFDGAKTVTSHVDGAAILALNVMTRGPHVELRFKTVTGDYCSSVKDLQVAILVSGNIDDADDASIVPPFVIAPDTRLRAEGADIIEVIVRAHPETLPNRSETAAFASPALTNAQETSCP